ncbi:G-type lectin S-receptor-like serine/threonine-protein kinase SD2-5 [Lactuca sativa]|uniref:G-type lectin S-receptor-like serine/threonine-protein kinase SD2-5 n=1 Tax=Lactuca sativa TaxID=4236 RepID=UPI000CD80C4A|nr:G-type lectin S-receptor-like serine/threonine-protein kinase SD2-5 [Lactuca sativa]
MRAPWICSLFFGFFFIFSSIAAQADYIGTANLSTKWTNDESSLPIINFFDGSRIRVILSVSKFMCGFFCKGACKSYLFAIIINQNDLPSVIWSANRDNLVKEGAILNLTAAGQLVLKEVDGSLVWATNTAGKSTSGMNLTEEGNLMLFNGHSSPAWQSFDHPTDCLVLGQKLLQGQKLMPSVSPTNWAAQKDLYSMEFTKKGLFFYVGSDPPKDYYSILVNGLTEDGYLELRNLSLCSVISPSKSNNCMDVIAIPPAFSPKYIKLMPAGYFKAFGMDTLRDGKMIDLPLGNLEYCSFPLACGRNGICSSEQQCSCPKSSSPGTDYFRAVNYRQPNMGCSQVTPITCNATKDQYFIEVRNVKYSIFTSDMKDVDIATCKHECLNRCSCKAAVFKYGSNSSGDCYLPSELYTITSLELDDEAPPQNMLVFIKVQNVGSTHSSKKKNNVATVVGSTIGSLLLLIVVVCLTKFVVKKRNMNSESEEAYPDQVLGISIRFTYDDLVTATDNFSRKLGQGGFGSVFEGTLTDGSKVAVKYLQGTRHVEESFLAEVESVGSIHHVNLVQLRGFCVHRSERLLVYELVSKGSLDEWIYNENRKLVLEWTCRKKIILGIAKGLTYLHEECRQQIIHFDIKPQNILLDEDFNAKVSDFGLSTLVDKDQSQGLTRMRGTPGYMAPEPSGSTITEKVDVYSFGIVLLEMLCARKNFDKSQPEDDWHLLSVFQRCWEQGTLLDIVDKYIEDMQEHGAEVVDMMKLASWCLQLDSTKRPSMSSVVRVLEGAITVESNLDYNFLHPRPQDTTPEYEQSSRPCDSVLSGPR